MTAQNYYARRCQRRRREVDIELMLELVQAERREQPRLGTLKLYHLIKPELKKAGVKLGRDRMFKELKKAGLLVPRKASAWPKTTYYNPNLPVFRNLLKDLKVTKPNQVWVADITYIRTEEGFMYLALVTDLWSRKIVGFELSESLTVEVVLRALAMALKSLKPGEKPIHHSDRGCQYASHVFVLQAQKAGLRMSMTETNHSAENSNAERVNGILKQEYWLDATFPDSSQAKRACAEAIRLYNMRRPHRNLAMKTPEQVHQA